MNLSDVAECEEPSEPEFPDHVDSAGIYISGFFSTLLGDVVVGPLRPHPLWV